MSTRKDITGQRFGRLVVVGPDHWDSGCKKWFWKCRCDCGEESIANGYLLRHGDTRSCGCLRQQILAQGRVAGIAASRSKTTAQGYVGTPTYRTWWSMLGRCFSPSAGNYQYYGGRGITVCERWRDFRNFLADMGPRPDGMSIDRVDVNGNYEPGNCRWATAKDQHRNRRPLSKEALDASAEGRKMRWR
jgi:hypothetical protein